MVVLRLPHLVLADVGYDDRAAVGGPPQVADDVRRVQVAIVGQVLDVAHRGVTLERVDAGDPVFTPPGFDAGDERAEHVAQIADHPDVDRDDLADLGGVDVDVDLLGLTGVGPDVAGHAVVEAHAERDEEVGLLNRGVDPRFTVHAHHAEIQRVRCGEGADAKQRHRDRNSGAFRELAEQTAWRRTG